MEHFFLYSLIVYNEFTSIWNRASIFWNILFAGENGSVLWGFVASDSKYTKSTLRGSATATGEEEAASTG